MAAIRDYVIPRGALDRSLGLVIDAHRAMRLVYRFGATAWLHDSLLIVIEGPNWDQKEHEQGPLGTNRTTAQKTV